MDHDKYYIIIIQKCKRTSAPGRYNIPNGGVVFFPKKNENV